MSESTGTCRVSDPDENEINETTQRYQTNVDVSRAVINTVDTVQLLFAMHNELLNHVKDVFLCERLPVCRCSKKDDCECDADDFTNIQSVKFDLGSNCTIICELTTKQDKLNHLTSVGSKQSGKTANKSTIRVFTLPKLTFHASTTTTTTTNEEAPIMDIVRHKKSGCYLVDHLHRLRYDLVDDIMIQDRSMIFKLNYMSWQSV